MKISMPFNLRLVPNKARKGFTLVELMVAMTVGLFIAGGILQIFLGSKQSYRATEAMSRLQENGRFALDYMSRDLRQIGFKGLCANGIKNLLNESNAAYTADRFDLISSPIRGWNGEKGDDPDVDEDEMASYQAGTDVIMFNHAAEASGLTVNGVTADTSAAIALTGSSGLLSNSILLIGDDANNCYICCDLFQNRATDNATSLSRAATGTPGNKDPSDPSIIANRLSHDYGTAMEIRLLRSRLYFIAPGENNVPALWERNFDKGTYEDNELVEGVFDMQISYLIPAGSTGNYLDASVVTNWNDVKAVKINLLLVSNEDNLVEQPMSLPFLRNDGTAFIATDRRIYQTFSSVIALRNRML
jgi:type IV pilus assembly protein PilW